MLSSRKRIIPRGSWGDWGNRLAARKKTAPPRSSRLDDARARMYHDLIFESAEAVLGAKGFDSATMQDIANEAGVSLKTLYAYFPGKNELYHQIMQERGAAFMVSIREAVGAAESPLARLEALVQAYVSFLLGHRDWLNIHLEERIGWALRPSKDYAAAYWEDGMAFQADVLREGMEQGVFFSADPMELAAMVHGNLQVMVAQAVNRGEENPEEIAATMLVWIRRLLCIDRDLADVPPEQRSA